MVVTISSNPEAIVTYLRTQTAGRIQSVDHNLHGMSVRAQNLGIYFLDPPEVWVWHIDRTTAPGIYRPLQDVPAWNPELGGISGSSLQTTSPDLGRDDS